MEFRDLSSRDKFIAARWAYSVGAPIISDAEYTLLLDYMKSAYPNDEYVNRSWSSDPCPTELLNAIGRSDLIHKVILADKTESIPSLNTELEVQTELQYFEGHGTLSMKHDGFNVQVNYYKGKLVNIMTRGRSCDAMDVSKLRSRVPAEIPVQDKIKIVCECTVSKANFPFCASMFGNVSERSAVSSVLAKPEYIHLLDVHAFDVHGYEVKPENKFELLQSWGFQTPKFYKVNNYNEIMMAMQYLSEAKDSYNSPTDGAVFDGGKRRALRIMAWEEPIYQSFVTGYLEQFNLYRISPSILIYPVLRGGTTQRRINITNWQRIINYDLQPGSPIAFRIASEATADFDEESTKILREQWKDRWPAFQEKIKEEEEAKRCQRNLYIYGS